MFASSATAVVLRTSMARSSAFQPGLRGALCLHSANIISSTFSRSAPSAQPFRAQSLSTAAGRRWTCALLRVPAEPRRHASTTPRTPLETDARAAQVVSTKAFSSTPEAEAAKALDWNAFFQLRKTRRWWQQGFSVIGAVTGGTGGAMLISTGAVDALASQLPLDPMVSLGLMTLGVAALGWVVGPSVGNLIFNLLKRKHGAAMAIKETQFFARIKKHRADPTSSSMNNPVPDFYGEKISSVTGYRQWLKDQRAFKKKKTTFL